MAIQIVNGYVLLPEPADWSDGAEIILQWQTGIVMAQRGYEDRAGLRVLPQAQMAWRVVTTTPMDGAALEDQVRAALRSGKACAPCYPRPCYLAGTGNGGLVVTLEPTQWSWQAGDYLFAVDLLGGTYVAQVQAVAGNQLTLATAIPVGATVVWPLMFGRLETEKPEQEVPDALNLGCRLYIDAWRLPGSASGHATYLNAPVVPVTVAADWSEAINRSFAYDAQAQQIGFGAETLENEQSWVQHGVEVSAFLRGDGPISDLESFFGVLDGRRGHFWLPAMERALLVLSEQSTQHFLIQEQGLADTWNSQPNIYLCFQKGSVVQMGQISAVTRMAPGVEQVQLTQPLDYQVDPTWDVYRLRLMRLGDDQLKEEYEADGTCTVRLSAVELPLEYTTDQFTPQPAYLYQFTAQLDATVQGCLTSHGEPITFQGSTYAPSAISHADIKRSVDNTDESVKVTTMYDANGPLATFLPFPPSSRLQVTIWRLDLSVADPEGSAEVEFQGFVANVRLMGRKLEALVQSPIDFMDRKLPTFFIGFLCNARLYGPGCNLNAADWQVNGQLASLNDIQITLTADPGKAQNYFAGGRFVTGTGASQETRTIMTSNGTALVLSYGLLKAVPGQPVTLFPGCAHNPTDCQGKFNNWDNYQGHPLVPYQNPTLNAIDVGSGGKK